MWITGMILHDQKKRVTVKTKYWTGENPKGHLGARVVLIRTLVKTLVGIESLFILWKYWMALAGAIIILCPVVLLRDKWWSIAKRWSPPSPPVSELKDTVLSSL